MAGWRAAPRVVLSESERSELKAAAGRRKTAQAMAMRARIVLACAEGVQSKQVAARLGVDPATVGKRRRRFAEKRLDGLCDEPRSGAPRTVDDARIEGVIVKTLESVPADATHWRSRGMAKACGLSVSTVQRIWRAFGLQPHRIESFIGDLEWMAMPPILLQQFRMFYAKDKPIGVILWASVNEEVEQRLVSGNARMRPQDWKSGDKLWIVEVLAPFGGTDEMLKDLKAKVFKDREVRFRAVEGGKGVVRVM